MGFLSNIFGKKQTENSNPDLAFYEALLEDIVVSDALKNELKANLKLAFEDPQSFYDDHNEFTLSERGLSYPKDSLLTPKFVLIDTLIDNGEMAEVDWKEEESEIRVYLNEMILAKNYGDVLSYNDQYEGYDTEEIIRLIDEKELQPKGYTIVALDINSDSYVFTIIPLPKKEKVKQLFERLKG